MDTTATQSLVLTHAPVRQGHFLLSSGMHSPSFIELEAIIQDPALAASIVQSLAARFRAEEPHVVLASLGPDAVLGFELARQLGARAIFTDGPLGQRSLRPAFRVKAGERVLILIGVIVTGDSARELIRLGMAAATKSESAVHSHTHRALEAGATAEERRPRRRSSAGAFAIAKPSCVTA